MAEWSTADLTAPDASSIILKAIPAGAYAFPEPYHPEAQVNPDGATYAAIAHLPSLCEPDVTAWVAAHQDGNLVMACFAFGLECGQVDSGCYRARITLEEERYIHIIARAQLAQHLGPRGYRTDHLASTRIPGEGPMDSRPVIPGIGDESEG